MCSLYVRPAHPLASCLHDVFAQYGGWERREEEEEVYEKEQGGAGISTSLTDVPPSARDTPSAGCALNLPSLQPSYNMINFVIKIFWFFHVQY